MKRRAGRSLTRRAFMQSAGAILVLSVAGWTTSLFRVEWNAPRSVALFNGELIVYDNFTASRSRWYVPGYDPKFSAPRWRWVQVGTPYAKRPHLYIRLPLWIPAAAASLVVAPLWLVDRKARRRQDKGFCPACAYDLTGITGPCPECGEKP